MVEETLQVRLSLPGRRRLRGWVAKRLTGACILLAGSGFTAIGQTTSVPIQTTEQSASIHGVVVNAATNRPLARALVQVEGRSILTGSDGRFEFAELNGGSTTTVRVTKPGFYDGLDPYQTATKSVAVGSLDDLEVKLYPEALITGSITTADGDPLVQIQVQALRRMDDESGSRWSMAGQTSTNGEGQFRLPLPGGDYVIETQYSPERFGMRGAVLPILVPSAGSNGGSGRSGAGGGSTLRLASGSEQHLDLHPPVKPSHGVHIQIDSSAGAAEGQFAPQIQVHLANGLRFSPVRRGAEKQGEVVVDLPNGSYLLSASMGGRNEAASYGETRVTVADEDVTGVTIHLQKSLELTIEASVDPAATETGSAGSATVIGSGSTFDAALGGTIDPGSASFLQQLGIFFQKTNAGVNLGTENVSPIARRGGPLGFTLLPGSYRLRTSGYSAWFIASATAGGTDLLTQDLVVDGGSSSVPLRLVVSNQTATLKGTTRIGQHAGGSYVYLIANAPSASPVIRAQSGNDGSFSHGQLPPGSYRVVASETRLYFDLNDPAVQKEFAPYMKTVTVAAGETESVDLDAMPTSELKP